MQNKQEREWNAAWNAREHEYAEHVASSEAVANELEARVQELEKRLQQRLEITGTCAAFLTAVSTASITTEAPSTAVMAEEQITGVSVTTSVDSLLAIDSSDECTRAEQLLATTNSIVLVRLLRKRA